MHEPKPTLKHTPLISIAPVDNTDWLKTAAIIFVSAGHFGFFFVDDDLWWSVLGRFAAPPFFFLVGFARSRTVPIDWVWVGIILTLLESWNAQWSWVAPNILLSFALIRLVRPHVQWVLERYGWLAFGAIVCALISVQPIAARLVDYGAEGWLWALFGLCQRRFAEGRCVAIAGTDGRLPPAQTSKLNWEVMRIIACLAAALLFLWQEQVEYAFPGPAFTAFVAGLLVLSVSLCVFVRAPSRLQPAEPIAACLRFIGRHTFEIYAIQLAGSELLVKLIPALAP